MATVKRKATKGTGGAKVRRGVMKGVGRKDKAETKTERRVLSSAAAHLSNDAGTRREVIRKCVREIDKLEREAEELRAAIRDIKTVRIKGELGMKIGDFNVALRLYRLDGGARDVMLDTCRECFDALGVGETLDWVQVADRAKEQRQAAAEEEGGEGGPTTEEEGRGAGSDEALPAVL